MLKKLGIQIDCMIVAVLVCNRPAICVVVVYVHNTGTTKDIPLIQLLVYSYESNCALILMTLRFTYHPDVLKQDKTFAGLIFAIKNA